VLSQMKFVCGTDLDLRSWPSVPIAVVLTWVNAHRTWREKWLDRRFVAAVLSPRPEEGAVSRS
jgi:hypothetical protein